MEHLPPFLMKHIFTIQVEMTRPVSINDSPMTVNFLFSGDSYPSIGVPAIPSQPFNFYSPIKCFKNPETGDIAYWNIYYFLFLLIV